MRDYNLLLILATLTGTLDSAHDQALGVRLPSALRYTRSPTSIASSYPAGAPMEPTHWFGWWPVALAVFASVLLVLLLAVIIVHLKLCKHVLKPISLECH